MIASDALNEPQEEEIPKGPGDDVDKELKAAQDAAKAAGEAAKNVFGKWYLWLSVVPAIKLPTVIAVLLKMYPGLCSSLL